MRLIVCVSRRRLMFQLGFLEMIVSGLASEVTVCFVGGFRSANTSAVSGSASSVLPIRECRMGPWRVLGRLKISMISGCMSGAMLPNSSAGKLT